MFSPKHRKSSQRGCSQIQGFPSSTVSNPSPLSRLLKGRLSKTVLGLSLSHIKRLFSMSSLSFLFIFPSSISGFRLRSHHLLFPFSWPLAIDFPAPSRWISSSQVIFSLWTHWTISQGSPIEGYEDRVKSEEMLTHQSAVRSVWD